MNSKTTRLLASVSPAALALAGGANAADLPRKAPPPVMPIAAPAYSWTGCYVGAHAGYGWSKQNATRTHTNIFNCCGGGAGTQLITSGTSGSLGIDSHGGVFGGQVGCQYQYANNMVFGVEGMFAGANIKGDTLSSNFVDPFFGSKTASSSSLGLKTQWITSATARLGWATWNNQALWYIKGGVAGVRNKLTTNIGAFDGNGQDRIGWTIGGGLEWAWTPNWSTFVDFSYYDFNRGNGFTAISFPDTRNTDIDSVRFGKQQMEVVKVGVNYKFLP